MSRRIVAYHNGRPLWADDGPARGRVAGYGTGAGGHAVTLVSRRDPVPEPPLAGPRADRQLRERESRG